MRAIDFVSALSDLSLHFPFPLLRSSFVPLLFLCFAPLAAPWLRLRRPVQCLHISLSRFLAFWEFLCEAVRLLMNNFKVDGLTRALTRQPSLS